MSERESVHGSAAIANKITYPLWEGMGESYLVRGLQLSSKITYRL
jgi:hypothetical protein